VTLDLLHRVRWTNVARAAAAVLALLLALAWPRLRAHQDALPPAVEPVSAAAARPPAAAKATRVARPARARETAAPQDKTAAGRAPITMVPKSQAAQRRAARRHRHTRHRRSRSPRVVPATTPVPASIVPSAATAPAAEFRP
jgi:hypothetical protein